MQFDLKCCALATKDHLFYSGVPLFGRLVCKKQFPNEMKLLQHKVQVFRKGSFHL